jgi:DNA modification methylase
LLISCPDRGVVMDIFGGVGTTALVALELGHDAISIDINRHYSVEAKKRLARWEASTGNHSSADGDRQQRRSDSSCAVRVPPDTTDDIGRDEQRSMSSVLG